MTNPDESNARSAGLYMRISRDVSGEALGVGRQEEDCRALAERLGWSVTEVYVDNDVSATSGKPRPAYRRMLEDIESGRIDAIIAWHPDRLYRRAVDLGELVEIVQRQRIPVATANAGDIDLNSPTGLLVAELLAAIAMYEVRHKSERWSRSWRQQRERGVVARTGSRMFGYDQDGVVVEEEAVIAREMAARILRSEPITHVAEWLETENVKATRGSAWTSQSIKRYLTNPRIAGWSTLNGEIVAKGEWEPILDQETFDTASAILTARKGIRGPRKSVLVGLIFCGKCGHRLITSGTKGRRSYRCPSRPGMRGCGGVTGAAAAIEAFVEAYVQDQLEQPEVLQRIAVMRARPADTLNDLTALDLRIRELEKQLSEPDVPVATLLRAIDAAKAKREDAAKTLANRSAANVFPAQGGEWPDDLQRRRALVDLVVQRCELKPVIESTGNRFDHRRVEVFDLV